MENYGTAKHVVVDDVYVHDINGNDAKDVSGSGGILASVTGEGKASNYAGLRITNNRVEHVTRTGIAAVASVWEQRTEVGDSTAITKPWTGNTGIVISNNNVLDTGGDGIVPQTALDAVVEHNRVHKFQQRSAGYNAGIWPWNSDGTARSATMRSRAARPPARDGMAFDIDQGTDRTLFEYNYSHDNEGGFFLMCNAAGRVANAVVRYNISQNDSFRGIETCSAGIESARVLQQHHLHWPGHFPDGHQREQCQQAKRRIQQQHRGEGRRRHGVIEPALRRLRPGHEQLSPTLPARQADATAVKRRSAAAGPRERHGHRSVPLGLSASPVFAADSRPASPFSATAA